MNPERGTRNAGAEAQCFKAAKTLVCFALKAEARAFQKVAGNRPDVQILLTGIGEHNARKAIVGFLQNNSPEFVFTCGFAGGLDPELRIGDVVFLTPDWRLDKLLTEAGAKPVSFYCASHMVTTASAKAKIRTSTRAGAVEMESIFIHQVCIERSISCATVRTISDLAQEDLPFDFNQLYNADQSLNPGRLAWAIAKSPGKIPALLRLQRNCQFAADRLAEILMKVIDPRLRSSERLSEV